MAVGEVGMMQWLQENWMQASTLFASILAAITGLVAVLIGVQQFRLARRAVQRPMPNIHCQAYAVDKNPDWTKILITVKNHSDVPISIEAAHFRKPRGIRIAKKELSNGFLDGRGQLPADINDETATATFTGLTTVEPVGTQRSLASVGDSYRTTIFAYHPIERLYSAKSPSIRFNLRWRDTSATTFHIDVTITTPDRNRIA